MNRFLNGLKNYIKKETVMTIAFLLAVVSSLVEKPTIKEITGFTDWRVLGILLSLMLAIAGLREIGLFSKGTELVLKKCHTARTLVMMLVLMCFFLSMAFTNDVALITFVPFALFLLESTGQNKLIIKTVVLETIAANLGSMLTPIGNPQNLYIFSAYKMSFFQLVRTMLPYSLLSLVGILAVIMLIPSESINVGENIIKDGKRELREEKIAAFAFIFLFSLLAVGKIIPWIPALAVAVGITFFTDRKVLLKVDYGLLLTFIFFFVFIGNIGSITKVREQLCLLLEGNEVIVSVLASQFLSNVPATLLLSEFTSNGRNLLIGVNLGGLGTLIASMASLISYKALAHNHYELKGRYLVSFTLYNLAFLALLMGLYFLLN